MVQVETYTDMSLLRPSRAIKSFRELHSHTMYFSIEPALDISIDSKHRIS
jgi:hypothetical protein